MLRNLVGKPQGCVVKLPSWLIPVSLAFNQHIHRLPGKVTCFVDHHPFLINLGSAPSVSALHTSVALFRLRSM